MITDRLKVFKGINTLYPYIMQRFLIQVKNNFRVRPLYPYEDKYVFDADTQAIIDRLASEIPADLWGDSETFSKNWPDIHYRKAKAQDIAAMVDAHTPDLYKENVAAELSDLNGRGYAILKDRSIPTNRVDSILDYLADKPVYPSHVPYFALQKPRTKEVIKAQGHAFGSYDLPTVMSSPEIARILSDHKVIGLIGSYFGCLPTVSSVNMFWSFTSTDGQSKGPQRYHRDVDDYKTNTMFINLTDTAENDGAHEYLEHTQNIDQIRTVFDDAKNNTFPKANNHLGRRFVPEDFFTLPLNGYTFDDLYRHFFSERSVQLHGQRGQVMVTDNYGIHRGIPPKSRDRLILWVSFALTATHTRSASVKYQKRIAYKDVADVVENNAVNRYVLRNIIDFR